MYKDQNQCIENKDVDFVITRNTKLEEYGLDASLYRCIDIATMPYEGADWTYYLYKLEYN